jgi:hypothetical protein
MWLLDGIRDWVCANTEKEQRAPQCRSDADSELYGRLALGRKETLAVWLTDDRFRQRVTAATAPHILRRGSLVFLESELMSDETPKSTDNARGIRRFVTAFFAAVARDLMQMVIAFSIGTGAAAVLCWYYGLPLFLSLLGGILVLGLALALKTDSLFD